MKQTPDESEILGMISDANQRANTGRLKRLRFLLMHQCDEPFLFSGLAYEYYEEARLCWYVGAFVATIVMAQLSFEETLRSYFRVVGGVQGALSNGKSVDKAGFANLIDEAHSAGLLSDGERDQLHRVRREYRNQYVHPKDIDKNPKSSKSDFFRQQLKIVAPDVGGESSEAEAQETIQTLVELSASYFEKNMGRLICAPHRLTTAKKMLDYYVPWCLVHPGLPQAGCSAIFIAASGTTSSGITLNTALADMVTEAIA